MSTKECTHGPNYRMQFVYRVCCALVQSGTTVEKAISMDASIQRINAFVCFSLRVRLVKHSMYSSVSALSMAFPRPSEL